MSDEQAETEANENAEDVDAQADDATAVESETEQEPTEEDAPEGLQDGDFVVLAYTARTADEGQLVDTTDEAVAEEEGVADQGTFEPRTIVLGAGHIFSQVEDAIIGHEVGHSDTVVVPAAEAFGEYDQAEVRTVAADKIPEDSRYPGAQVQIDNEEGYLETIIGGRARVDFNHPLAGEDVEYDFEVVDVVDDRLEQAQGLLNMFLDVDLEMSLETDEVEEEQLVETDEDDEDDDEDAEPEYETVTVEKETLYIESTPQLSFNQQWLFQKQQIAQQIMDRVGIDRVIIRETIDGSGMGMGGMMGGMGGMMGGAGGAGEGGEADLEELVDEDIDEEELLEELDADLDE